MYAVNRANDAGYVPYGANNGATGVKKEQAATDFSSEIKRQEQIRGYPDASIDEHQGQGFSTGGSSRKKPRIEPESWWEMRRKRMKLYIKEQAKKAYEDAIEKEKEVQKLCEEEGMKRHDKACREISVSAMARKLKG